MRPVALMPRFQGGTRLAVTIAALAAATLCPADRAHAFTDVRVIGTTLRVAADPGRANRITIFDSGTYVRVRDTNDFVAWGPGCVFVDAHTADCPRAGIARAIAFPRDMDDWALNFTSVPIRLYGEEGDDILRGGTGDDLLDGGAGADAMFGDTGQDRTTYAAKPAGVTVSLDNVANDGIANEKDNVSPTIENVTGSPSDDVIWASASPNVIEGGRGNDRIWGFDGADTFPTPTLDGADDYNGGAGVDRVDYTRRPDRVVVQLDGAANDGAAAEGDNVRLDVEDVTGGDGDDVLLGNGLDNQLDGVLGNDHLDGRGGADTLIGGLGIDRLFGGFGNDVLKGFDGTAANDWLDGQADVDTCDSDAGDTENNCEL